MNHFRIIKIALAFMILVACSFASTSGTLETKTFWALKKYAFFLESGHKKYDSFTDNDFKILKVTNLDKTGPGSFRWAIDQSGPRVVVFEVGGTIDLAQSNLSIKQPYLFVAGQTAPFPGITIIRGGIGISAHDVIIQHISIRPGDCSQPKKSGWETDGLSANSATNVVIDHCSFTWATDENLSSSGPRHEGVTKTSRNITFSNCIIAEGLYDSSHSKGIHSMGTLIHDYCTNIAVVGNLYAHNNQRNPLLKPNSAAFIANNLVYNPKNRAIHGSWPVDEYIDHPDSLRNAKATVIGNVLIPGKDTRSDMFFLSGKFSAYQKDNIIVSDINSLGNQQPGKITSSEVEILKDKPIWTDEYKVISSDQVVLTILKTSGSRPAERNSIDQRIIDSVRNKTGKVINSQNEVGGYPAQSMVKRELQIPSENIERWLEDLSEKWTN